MCPVRYLRLRIFIQSAALSLVSALLTIVLLASNCDTQYMLYSVWRIDHVSALATLTLKGSGAFLVLSVIGALLAARGRFWKDRLENAFATIAPGQLLLVSSSVTGGIEPGLMITCRLGA